MRFLDSLRARLEVLGSGLEGERAKSHRAARDALERVEVFTVDNVARRYFEDFDPKMQGMKKPTEFKNWAPPYPRVWMEFQMPKSIRRCEDSFGAVLWSQRCVSTKEPPNFGGIVRGSLSEQFGRFDGWHLLISGYRGDKRGFSQLGHTIIAIDHTGDARDFIVSEEAPERIIGTVHVGRTVNGTIGTVPAVCGLALSFLNCRNIGTETHDPPVKVQRKRARRGRRPLVRFKTLVIVSSKASRASVGAGKDSDFALHLCRGHFKTYGPERPLMGQHVGTYWWEDHARGSGKNGVIHKDYEHKKEIS